MEFALHLHGICIAFALHLHCSASAASGVPEMVMREMTQILHSGTTAAAPTTATAIATSSADPFLETDFDLLPVSGSELELELEPVPVPEAVPVPVPMPVPVGTAHHKRAKVQVRREEVCVEILFEPFFLFSLFEPF